MADTIKIPGIGDTKKEYVYIGGGLIVIVIGVVYVRSRSTAKASAAAAAAAASSTDSTDTTTTPIDEATGYPQGSAEDLAALAQQQDLEGVDYGTTDDSGSTDVTTGTGYTSNAAWAQAAEEYIVDTTGGVAGDVGNALGKYLTGGSLTSDMVDIVNQAIAFDGPPPQSGVNGYPPSLNIAPVTPPPVTPPPVTPPPVTPPPVTPPPVTPPPTTTVHDVTFHMFVPNSGSYDAMAQKYGVFNGSGQGLYEYQLTPNAQRSAAALAELKAKPYPYLSNGGSTAIPW